MVLNLTMALAPVSVTSLFAFSIESQILGGNLVYVVMLVLSMVGAVHSLALREPKLAEQTEGARDRES